MEASARLVGRQVGDFRLVDWIGEGGMGAAFRAEQLTLRRDAVVKVIAAPDVSEEAKHRFLREARLASRLDHPYAAHVYAFGAEDDGLLWIAMELVRGIPLDRMLADQGVMPLQRFVPFFDRLCEVIYSAHEQGIIHRDIKPANVMAVRRAGRLLPKLLDFGIARTALEVEEAPAGEVSDSPLDASTRPITMRGKLVGSPEYMAPEQWVDAARATPRTDLYALAITAYEMLSGRRPFTGPTVLAVARAHARADVPPLGPGLPAALDHVFARALAKREAQRYDNVLELAAAIRDAARELAIGSVTDLDEVVRDTFVQSGPQPLAEALLELAAAREPGAAWEAGWCVVGVLARVLGAIALGSAARIGERTLPDAAAARVRALVERGLDVEEWLALGAELTAPFADKAQGHPVPDLVAAFASGLFAPLLALRGGGDAVDAERVQLLLGELGKVLRGCAFLVDYRWVAARAGGGELWMGPRRHPRERVELPATALAGTLWLVDGDGAPVLELSPLVHIAPPAPGADDEAFVLDGPAKRGARAVAWPREFERYDDGLWQFVDQQLVPLRDRGAAAEAGDVAPYRGLSSFGPGDAAMFFGREREVEATVNRLRVQPLIAVVGPSGVGKSSFVHAGVVPALPETWQTISLRPGASPLAAVESRLGAAGIVASGLADKLRGEPRALGAALEDGARRQGTRIVVVIDQLEEMFTQCRDAATRDQFARALSAIGGESSPVHVVLTLRDDFLVRAAELPGLGARLQAGLELVTLPDPNALRRILVEPLRRVGYAFENEALPDEMVSSVREHPGALALLSFAAAKLWELRDRGFRHIPKRAYEAIGGVAGALARHAEDTLSALPGEDHALVRELFRHLVTSEGTRATLLRAEAIQLLGKSHGAERVIETLVERRLIVGYEGDAQTERIEVIHEALLTAWPRLVQWQREDAEGARLRDQVRSAARQWGERGKPKGLLWRGEALVELKLWRSRYNAALTDLEHEFTAASVADDARSRRLRRLGFAAVLAGLVIGIIVLQRANGVAERNADDARRRALALLVEQGRASLVAGHPQEAMVYLAQAYQDGAGDANLPYLLGVGERALVGEQLVLRGHGKGAKWGELTADGAHVVTAANDGKIRVWSARTGALEHELVACSGPQFVYPQLSPDGGILTWGMMEAPAMWDAATGARRFALPVPAGSSAVMSKDGRTIATLEPGKLRTWNADGTPRGERAIATDPSLYLQIDGDRYVADVADGTAVGTLDLAAPPRVIEKAHNSFSGAGGSKLAAIRTGNRMLLWDLDQPQPEPRALEGHGRELLNAAFSPDGTQLATGSADHSAKIWDVATGRMLVSLDGHVGFVFAIAWSPDGKLVATGSTDRTVRVWDARTGATRAVFYGHTDAITAVRFDRGGDRLVSASLDGTVRVFDLHRQTRRIDLAHQGPLTVRFSGDSRRLLVVGQDSTAWVFDVATGAQLAAFGTAAGGKSNRMMWARQRACGDIDATGDAIVVPVGSEAHVIRLADPLHPTVLAAGAPVTCARFAPGDRVVLGTASGQLQIWKHGAREQQVAAHADRIGEIAIDFASGAIATASDDRTAKVGLLDDLEHTLHEAVRANGPVRGVALSLGGRLIATASSDTIARVHDVARGFQLVASHGLSDGEAISFSPDDHRIAVANSKEGAVTIYDARDGRLLAQLGDVRASGWLYAAQFAPDGSVVATADDLGQIRFWPTAIEARPPDVVMHDVTCHVPLALIGSHVVARVTPSCTDMSAQ
ncbi:MAG TPA: protein kinase [Kofleriaceae bacterium]|nr:protein kinase [Kofleriaceae bacterium]